RNLFSVASNANCFGGNFFASANPDYAECFISNLVLPRGTSVTINSSGDLAVAQVGDDPIGVVAENPSFCAGALQDVPNSDPYVVVALLGQVPIQDGQIISPRWKRMSRPSIN